jgi:hypothetical protein
MVETMAVVSARLRTTWSDDKVSCVSRTNVSHFHVVLEGLSLAVHSASLHLPCSSLRVPQTTHERE